MIHIFSSMGRIISVILMFSLTIKNIYAYYGENSTYYFNIFSTHKKQLCLV